MPWSWLTFWRPRKKCAGWDVVVYTRKGCHLCEQAWHQLQQAQGRYHFALSQVDIEDDARLAQEYGECVPVVIINGRVRFRGIVNPVLLKRLFSSRI